MSSLPRSLIDLVTTFDSSITPDQKPLVLSFLQNPFVRAALKSGSNGFFAELGLSTYTGYDYLQSQGMNFHESQMPSQETPKIEVSIGKDVVYERSEDHLSTVGTAVLDEVLTQDIRTRDLPRGRYQQLTVLKMEKQFRNLDIPLFGAFLNRCKEANPGKANRLEQAWILYPKDSQGNMMSPADFPPGKIWLAGRLFGTIQDLMVDFRKYRDPPMMEISLGEYKDVPPDQMWDQVVESGISSFEPCRYVAADIFDQAIQRNALKKLQARDGTLEVEEEKCGDSVQFRIHRKYTSVFSFIGSDFLDIRPLPQLPSEPSEPRAEGLAGTEGEPEGAEPPEAPEVLGDWLQNVENFLLKYKRANLSQLPEEEVRVLKEASFTPEAAEIFRTAGKGKWIEHPDARRRFVPLSDLILYQASRLGVKPTEDLGYVVACRLALSKGQFAWGEVEGRVAVRRTC